MPDLNPAFVEAVKGIVNVSPYFELQSMKLLSFEVGSCLMEIDLARKHLQPFGLVHGGVFASIIDAAAFWAVYADLNEESGLTSVDLKLNYLAPATTGKLIARGRRVKVGRTLALGEAEITNEKGRLLAHGLSTLMVLPNDSLSNRELLPSKFV